MCKLIIKPKYHYISQNYHHISQKYYHTVLNTTLFARVFVQTSTVFSHNTKVFSQSNTVFSQNTAVFSQNTTVFAINTTVFCQNTTVFSKNTTVFALNTTFFAQNNPVFAQKGLYSFNMVQNCLKWSILVWNAAAAKLCKLAKIVQFGPNWAKIVRNGPKCSWMIPWWFPDDPCYHSYSCLGVRKT